jgi:hypothetical protein
VPRRVSIILTPFARRTMAGATCVAAAAVATLVLSLGVLSLGVLTASAAQTASQAPSSEVEIASVNPSGGLPGTEISYTLAGTDEAGSEQCATSSAYRLEFLAPDGTLTATGGETVAVPATALPGDSFIRLVCYVPDATSRRVIYGLCGSFVVSAPGEAVPEERQTAAADCPPTPRLVLGQSVIAVERAMSEAFNPLLFYPLPK